MSLVGQHLFAEWPLFPRLWLGETNQTVEAVGTTVHIPDEPTVGVAMVTVYRSRARARQAWVNMSERTAGFSPAQWAVSSSLNVSNSGHWCCMAVLSTDMRINVAYAPLWLRLPPVIFRSTTAGRIARSAALLVGSTSLTFKKVVSSPA